MRTMSFWIVLLMSWCCASCAHRSPSRPPSPPEHYMFEGTLEVAGHLATPGATTSIPITVHVWEAHDSAQMSFVTTHGERTRTQTWWLQGATVVHGAPDKARALGGAEADAKLALMRGLIDLGRERDGYSRSYAHPTFGDVTDSARRIGDTIQLEHAEADLTWSASIRQTALQHEPPTPLPREILPARPERRGPLALQELADGVFMIDLEAHETRTLIIEFSDHLVALETSLTVTSSEQVIALLTRRWPTKPVRYVAFSHHHPHYTGGLRAYIAAGATVITPLETAAFVRELSERAFTLAPDSLARSPRACSIETYDDTFVIEDKVQRVEIYNLGEGSKHTKAYSVFYLPRQRILFEGDLGWFIIDGELRRSSRLTGLTELVESKQLEVETVIQSWPIQPPIEASELFGEAN